MANKNKSVISGVAIALVIFVFGGIMVLGVLAAIAVPSFMRYIKMSKVAEATSTVKQIELGVKGYVLEHCKFPPLPEPTSALPTGGEKTVPTISPEWETVGVNDVSPRYFRYRLLQPSEGLLEIVADTDFNPGGEAHTVRVVLTKKGCELDATPAETLHELE